MGVLAGALRLNELEGCENNEVEGDLKPDVEVLMIMVELLTAQGGGVEAIGGQLKVTAKPMKDYNGLKK